MIGVVHAIFWLCGSLGDDTGGLAEVHLNECLFPVYRIVLLCMNGKFVALGKREYDLLTLLLSRPIFYLHV